MQRILGLQDYVCEYVCICMYVCRYVLVSLGIGELRFSGATKI